MPFRVEHHNKPVLVVYCTVSLSKSNTVLIASMSGQYGTFPQKPKSIASLDEVARPIMTTSAQTTTRLSFVQWHDDMMEVH